MHSEGDDSHDRRGDKRFYKRMYDVDPVSADFPDLDLVQDTHAQGEDDISSNQRIDVHAEDRHHDTERCQMYDEDAALDCSLPALSYG